MCLDNNNDNRFRYLHDVAGAITGLSVDKVNKIKALHSLWQTYKREGKGFRSLYKSCVDLGVELSNAQRDVHIDPINGAIVILKFQAKETYRLSDVADALDMFYEAMTAFDADADAFKKKLRKRNGRRKSQNETSRRLRSDAKI